MRTRFKRSCLASSRGNYVRQSHFLYIQRELKERGIEASIEDIIEVSTHKVTIQTKYYIKCFGQLKPITKEEAMKLDSTLIIIQ